MEGSQLHILESPGDLGFLYQAVPFLLQRIMDDRIKARLGRKMTGWVLKRKKSNRLVFSGINLEGYSRFQVHPVKTSGWLGQKKNSED